MVQIISDKPSNWLTWIGEVVEYLEKFPNISKMVVAACADDESGSSQVIQFMNCSTDDVYYLGGVLQKEAIKHEMAEEFGFDDDSWDIEEE